MTWKEARETIPAVDVYRRPVGGGGRVEAHAWEPGTPVTACGKPTAGMTVDVGTDWAAWPPSNCGKCKAVTAEADDDDAGAADEDD